MVHDQICFLCAAAAAAGSAASGSAEASTGRWARGARFDGPAGDDEGRAGGGVGSPELQRAVGDCS